MLRYLSILLICIGAGLTGLQVYRLASQVFTDAEVTHLETYLGQCRRPSGRYEECARVRARVRFVPPGSSTNVEALIEAGRSPTALAPGSSLKVMYPAGEPGKAVLANIRTGWTIPLGVLTLGSILLIITVKARKKA